MDGPPPDPLLSRLERRAERERRARLEAEDLLEAKSRELYQTNVSLSSLAAELETRVEQRTRELAGAREQAVLLAERDQLTGLPNRMRFGRALETAAAGAGLAAMGRFALLLIDIDKFKDINDGLGHEAGDVLLQHVASRLETVLPKPDMVARLGGDEFAAIVTDCATPSRLARVAEKVIAAIKAPVPHGDRLIETSCSVGIAMFPHDSQEVGELQRFADLALYAAKAAGRAKSMIFDDTMRREYDERHLLGAETSRAIEQGEIEPWFQPIVDGASSRMVGLEALARWRHPTRGLLPPALFLKLAEERGLTNALFAHMLRTTCRLAKPWVEEGLTQYVAINASPAMFRAGSPADDILAIVREVGFPPRALKVEITEDLLLFDLGRARAQLERLAAGGVRVALDDFGVGYSNIGYLRRLPIHTLKLDRMLTVDVCVDPKARSILGAIVDIARALDLELVAEGVEEKAQALWLSRLGCRHQQGYLFGRPMPANEVEAMARAVRPPLRA